jgi:long-subunit acyl-CoA synthetase (AMP-forming)
LGFLILPKAQEISCPEWKHALLATTAVRRILTRGELYLRGENIALGYRNNEKATRETFVEGGWLRTGDRFKVDKDGNFL